MQFSFEWEQSKPMGWRGNCKTPCGGMTQCCRAALPFKRCMKIFDRNSQVRLRKPMLTKATGKTTMRAPAHAQRPNHSTSMTYVPEKICPGGRPGRNSTLLLTWMAATERRSPNRRVVSDFNRLAGSESGAPAVASNCARPPSHVNFEIGRGGVFCQMKAV
jgi:hypothetical protein